MTTTSSRLGLILPDDGGAGGDDTVDVTAQISNNFSALDAAVGLFECTAITRPVTGNFNGRLILETDTGKTYRYDGAAWKFQSDNMIGMIRARLAANGPPYGQDVYANQAFVLDFKKGEKVDSIFTFANGGTTVLVAGVYAVQLTYAAVQGTVASTGIKAKLFAPALANKVYCEGWATVGTPFIVNASAEVYLNAGTQIFAALWNDSGLIIPVADGGIYTTSYSIRRIPGL